MDQIEEKANKLRSIREDLFWDDWAIHWLINTLNDLQSQDE